MGLNLNPSMAPKIVGPQPVKAEMLEAAKSQYQVSLPVTLPAPNQTTSLCVRGGLILLMDEAETDTNRSQTHLGTEQMVGPQSQSSVLGSFEMSVVDLPIFCSVSPSPVLWSSRDAF